MNCVSIRLTLLGCTLFITTLLVKHLITVSILTGTTLIFAVFFSGHKFYYHLHLVLVLLIIINILYLYLLIICTFFTSSFIIICLLSSLSFFNIFLFSSPNSHSTILFSSSFLFHFRSETRQLR